jgi:hypothetical protein
VHLYWDACRCLLLMDGDAVDHLHLESRQRTGLFGAFDICNNPCFSISPPSSTGAAGVPAPATLSLVYSDALRLNPRDPEELETCIRVASIDANNPQPLGEEAPAIRLSWPVGFEPPKGLSLVLRGANGDGAVLFHVRGSPQRLFQVSPSDGQVQLLAGPAPGAEHANWATNRDYWQGCSLGQVRLPYLECSTLDADGNLVGFDEEAGMLIRIRLGLKPPVHLQPPPAPPPPPPTWDIELASPGQLGSDWGALLASGEGADVELRCAGGAVHKAHSLVLSARCEWFRRRQSSGLGNTAVVDLPEHTAATMACVLQFLYTGHVSLAPSAAPIAQDSTAAAAASSTGAVAAAAAAASDTSDVWQLLRSVSYFQGLSAHDPVLLVPLLMVAADQLQLPDLHEACLQLAQIQLSPRTALPWLLAAHMGKLEALQKAAFEYVAANYAGKGEGEAGSNHGRPCRQHGHAEGHVLLLGIASCMARLLLPPVLPLYVPSCPAQSLLSNPQCLRRPSPSMLLWWLQH